jgi:hypothetical protein
LPLLKVCYAENRSDNCGQCLKCLHTMTCLRVAGALEQATGFPPSLDLEALEALTPRPQPFVRHSFAELRNAALELGDRELAAALTSMIERTAAAGVPDQRERDSFRITHMNAVATLVRTWSSDCGIAVHADRAAHIGLLRTVDLRARRHSYAIGGSRADALTAELGALIAPGCGGEIPVWTLADGRVVTDRYLPPNPSVGGWARARFCVLPLRAGQHPLGRRIRLALRRVLDAFLLRPPTPARLPESGNPVGSLFEEPSEGRLPLWSGVHPVLADQLLTWSSEPLERAGYVDACLLGYLVATAPHTGRLGTESPPLVPWVGAGEIIEDRP